MADATTTLLLVIVVAVGCFSLLAATTIGGTIAVGRLRRSLRVRGSAGRAFRPRRSS
jgi:hypothetical protein